MWKPQSGPGAGLHNLIRKYTQTYYADKVM
jgi:hypothetical protein